MIVRSIEVLRKFPRKETLFQTLLIGTLLFWKPYNNDWSAMWTERWGFLLFFAGVTAIYKLNLSRIQKAFLFWLLSMSVIRAAFPLHRDTLPNLDYQDMVTALKLSSMDYLLCLFGFIAFLWLQVDLGRVLRISAWVVCAGIVYNAANASNAVPWLQNPSIAACFVVLASGVSPFSLLAVILTHSWVAFFAWSLGTLYAVWGYLSWADLGILILGSTPALFFFPRHLPDNGRFQIWRNLTEFWYQMGLDSILYGLGPGTTRLYLPYTDYMHHVNNQVAVFVWLHNDFLQALIELGVMGAFLGALSWIGLFSEAKKPERKTLLAYSVVMMGNFPLHWALTALVGWSLVVKIKGPPDHNSEGP